MPSGERTQMTDLTFAGGFAIAEKFSYTKEAMETYMRALAPGGVLSVTLWNKEEPPKSVLKLYATMAAAAREVDPAHMANSFFVASSYLSTATVLYNLVSHTYRHLRRGHGWPADRARKSVLDWITGEVERTRRQLGAADRSRLDRYLDNVREIERRIQAVEAQNRSGDARELPDAPAGVPDSFSEHMRLLFDLQVLALVPREPEPPCVDEVGAELPARA